MGEKRRVVVTGMSVLCAGGNDKNAFMQNTRTGKCSIRKTDLFSTEKLRTDYFGQIEKPYIYEVEKEDQPSRLECLFADLGEQLLEDARLTKEEIAGKEERAGFSFATSVGANDYITAYVKGTMKNALAKSNLYKLPSALGIGGPVFVNTSACAAGTTAIGTAYSMLVSGAADMVIAGGIDPLTEFSSYGFHSLQNLSAVPCRPFDKNRDGITLGEGGALFVLEELTAARERGAHIYAELSGYGLGNDAYHATSPDPSGKGACRVMKQAMEQAGIQPEEVDYVNAHGTGTLINDSTEVKAMEQLGLSCAVTSTKSQIGHCLAAAGAIEFAATVLSMQEQEIFPGVHLSEEMETQAPIRFVKDRAEKRRIKYALSNSFAFAGNAAVAAIGRYENDG